MRLIGKGVLHPDLRNDLMKGPMQAPGSQATTLSFCTLTVATQ